MSRGTFWCILITAGGGAALMFAVKLTKFFQKKNFFKKKIFSQKKGAKRPRKIKFLGRFAPGTEREDIKCNDSEKKSK